MPRGAGVMLWASVTLLLAGAVVRRSGSNAWLLCIFGGVALALWAGYRYLKWRGDVDYWDWSRGPGNPENRCRSCDNYIIPMKHQPKHCPHCGHQIRTSN